MQSQRRLCLTWHPCSSFAHVTSGLASNTLEGFRDELNQYWFGDYGRRNGGPVDSSGFEHVLVGEIDSSGVTGFHNWVQFYLEERDGDLEFEHLWGSCEVTVLLTLEFYHNNAIFKSQNVLFLSLFFPLCSLILWCPRFTGTVTTSIWEACSWPRHQKWSYPFSPFVS